MCFRVQGGSGSECFYSNPISLRICMASLWVQGKSNGCGHCALTVTSVVHVLIHVYSIVCLTVYRAEVGVCVYTNSISPSIVMAFLRIWSEFSECSRCSHWALCLSQCKVRSSTLRV